MWFDWIIFTVTLTCLRHKNALHQLGLSIYPLYINEEESFMGVVTISKCLVAAGGLPSTASLIMKMYFFEKSLWIPSNDFVWFYVYLNNVNELVQADCNYNIMNSNVLVYWYRFDWLNYNKTKMWSQNLFAYVILCCTVFFVNKQWWSLRNVRSV